ncbi:MAG: GDP-mannose 4,6-dehydratase [Planctomycetales bacterium]|nr:GDP-mannose 4,6-dehydratase [Planctomycetales bacterium]
MRRVVVTGGAGFIGSHLTRALLDRGDQVLVVDDESTGTADNLSEVRDHPRLDLRLADISDPALVREIVAGADQLYHLAAAVGVALIAKQPIETIERNIYPTQLLLSEVRHHNAAGGNTSFFLASTSEVYGKNPKDCWCEEDDLVFGPTTRTRWSYGASKAIDEFLTLACHRQHALPAVIGRFFNVVGPRQSGAYGMVLPRFVEAAVNRRALEVHDDGQQIRCFAHVSDVVAAVLQLMDTPRAFGEVVNIGSDEPISILGLAERVNARAENPTPVKYMSYTEAYDKDFEDIRRRVPDLGKLKSLTGLSARYRLDDIIDELVEQARAR